MLKSCILYLAIFYVSGKREGIFLWRLVVPASYTLAFGLSIFIHYVSSLIENITSICDRGGDVLGIYWNVSSWVTLWTYVDIMDL